MYSTTTRLATLVSLLLPLTSATFTFNGTWGTINATLSTSLGLSDACVKAYAMSIDCPEDFIVGVRSDGQTNSTLEGRCTDQCINGLRKWRDAIRSDCTTEDVQKANATTSDPSGDGNSNEGPSVLVVVANKEYAGAEYMYWLDCMKDLNTGEFCVFSPDIRDESKNLPANTTDPDYNATNIPAFCNSSCLTQESAFMYEIASTLGDNVDSIADVRKTCPGVDINSFPLIKSLQPVDSSTSNSNSSSTGSSSTTRNSSTSSTTAAPNAAGSLKAASLLGSTLLVGVIVGLGLL